MLITYSINKIKRHQVARVCPHKPVLHLHLMHEWRAQWGITALGFGFTSTTDIHIWPSTDRRNLGKQGIGKMK